MTNYKFYIQQCTKEGVMIDGTKRDLEADFDGLRYAKCEGLNSYGATKNIYTEKYADSETLRAYVPDEVLREATEIKFTFYIFGDASKRQSTLDAFIAYLDSGKYFYYWDTARKRRFMFIPPTSVIAPSDELWYAGNPYFKFELTLQNMKGYTEAI